NIGSGKTTHTECLAHHYGWIPKYEAVDYNPYLEDYYKDIPRWSFNMEVFFLKERFKDLLTLAKSSGKETFVQDRSIYEGVYVFTENNYQMGNLSARDFHTYMELFESMTHILHYPDLMIYLRSSVSNLVKNIQKRGRDYEQQMPLEYLERLNQLYEEFVFQKYQGKVMVVEVDTLDFLRNKKDFSGIIDQIDAHLFGLF
ncbi:MAG: deoxynucleoside kinase, partial [Prevotella sp.]|nr:deoxynucleoside kinase [Prevotella sp.]